MTTGDPREPDCEPMGERERWSPTPCEKHRFSSSLYEMNECAACDFRGQVIARAVTVLDGHPGLRPWEPPALAEAMLVAVGLIEGSDETPDA